MELDNIDLDEILKEVNEDDLTVEPPKKLEFYQRQTLRFLVHDLEELSLWHRNCDECYCETYCQKSPHLECRQTRYEYLSRHVIDHNEPY